MEAKNGRRLELGKKRPRILKYRSDARIHGRRTCILVQSRVRDRIMEVEVRGITQLQAARAPRGNGVEVALEDGLIDASQDVPSVIPPTEHVEGEGIPHHSEDLNSVALPSAMSEYDGVYLHMSSPDRTGQQIHLDLVRGVRDPGSSLRQVASAHAVSALPTFDWHGGPDGTISSCAICTEDLEEGSCVTGMPCGHLFHATCLHPWLRQHYTCPMCRFKLPIDTGSVNECRVPPTSAARVRPASSAPARSSGGDGTRGRQSCPAITPERPSRSGHVLLLRQGADSAPRSWRRHRLGGEEHENVREPTSDNEGQGRQGHSPTAGMPVVWTSINSMNRPGSASNPATWPLEKLQGVLSEGGVSYQHCHDRSSLVEMVIMCMRDYANAGSRFDQQRRLLAVPSEPDPLGGVGGGSGDGDGGRVVSGEEGAESDSLLDDPGTEEQVRGAEGARAVPQACEGLSLPSIHAQRAGLWSRQGCGGDGAGVVGGISASGAQEACRRECDGVGGGEEGSDGAREGLRAKRGDMRRRGSVQEILALARSGQLEQVSFLSLRV